MSLRILNRRHFLSTTAGSLSFLLPLSSCSQNKDAEKIAVSVSNLGVDILSQFFERLLPIKGIDKSVFASITQDMLENAKSNEGLRQNLKSCVSALQNLSDYKWLELEPVNQSSILKDLEGEAWFVDILIRAKGSLFYHPKFWNLIQYEGPSLENGGYKYRGFDDIDWLPETAK